MSPTLLPSDPGRRLLPVLFPVLLILLFGTCSKDDDEGGNTPEANAYYGAGPFGHEPGPGLTLLDAESFQQTTEYTCGPAAVVSLLRYYGRDGDEMTIAAAMGTSTTCGTTPEQMTAWLNDNGFTASWHEHGDLSLLRNRLASGIPTLVEWSDWGGHWVLVTGYDTRNTESLSDDVILFADPYDRHDEHPDGFTWFNAERFYYMWYDALLFGSTLRQIFIEAAPSA